MIAPNLADMPNPSDRRAWVRFPCDLGSSCCASAGDDRTRWTARMQDISRGGARVVVDRRFEPGTILNIQVEAAAREDIPSVLLARVVHVKAESGGFWALGCRFARELTEKDLYVLVGPVRAE
jgi:PilZ domain